MIRLIQLLVILVLSILFVSIAGAQMSEGGLYKVGVGDIIEIIVLGHRDLATVASIGVDGTISFPHLGSIYIKDKTLVEIKEEITKGLSEGYIKLPVVSVFLKQALSTKIFIHGEVNRIGAVPYEKDITIIKALSIAGGINDQGLYGKIKLRRKQKDDSGYKTVIEEELNNGIIKNKQVEDTILQPDDILIVERNETFLIQGEVSNRGRFTLEKNMTVLRVLLEAGGTNPDGRYGKLRIRRKEEGTQGGYKVIAESNINDGVLESSEVEGTILQPDDILIVERNETFLIQGEVPKRGRFVLEKNMTVLRALLEAGGIAPDGRYGKLRIRRKEEGAQGGYQVIAESNINDGVLESSEVEGTILQPDDILIVERNETFLIQGEVPKRGRLVLEKNMTVLRALLEAGGTTPDGRDGKLRIRRKEEGAQGVYKEIVESNINDGIIEDSKVEGAILQPDDILIVEKNRTYYIYGEANSIGEFVLKHNMTVFKALTIARGFTKWGSKSRVEILRLTGTGEEFVIIKVNIKDILDGDASADMLLQPGDTVVVSSGIF